VLNEESLDLKSAVLIERADTPSLLRDDEWSFCLTAATHAAAQTALSQVQSAARAAGPQNDGSVGDFVTSIRTACSLSLAWPGLTAPPVPAHPFGRSLGHVTDLIGGGGPGRGSGVGHAAQRSLGRPSFPSDGNVT
jgi:hypothetical protein